MEKAAHTHGPWSVDQTSVHSDHDFALSTVRVADCSQASRRGKRGEKTVPIGYDECAANAAFIVRACNAHDDMLAALQELLKAHAAANADPLPAGSISVEPFCVFLARAAIAKATGADTPQATD